MQILQINGKDVKRFPANSKESPLRALLEAGWDNPEGQARLLTEISTPEGKLRLRSVYSEEDARKVANEILDERESNE